MFIIFLFICIGILTVNGIYRYKRTLPNNREGDKKEIIDSNFEGNNLFSFVVNPDEIEWPVDFEWKFTKANLIALKDSVDGYLHGKCFFAYNIPGLYCHLVICPNGEDDCRGETWLFLYVNASKERKITAEFKFSIESANYVSESVNDVYESYEGCGENICKTDEFFDRKNKYFMDEEITIKVKGILKAQRSLIPSLLSKISSKISLKWKIKEDDLKEAIKPESKGLLKSKEISIPSFYYVRYHLMLDTKKRDAKNQAQMDLILYVEFGDEKKIEAVVEFSVDSVGYGIVFEPVYENCPGYGTKFCLTEDLFDPSKRYIVDGYLTINLTGVFMVKRKRRITMKCKNCLPQNQDPKDFLICIGEKEIQIHKQILMDVSPVFAGMIESGMKESIENKMMINDFPLKVVTAAIKLFYNQNGLCHLTMEEMFLLHKFADKYFIEFLLDHVEHALIKMISSSNVCLLLKLSASDSYKVPKLHESCIKFLDKCYKESIPVYGAESLGEKYFGTMGDKSFKSFSSFFFLFLPLSSWITLPK